MRVIRNTAGLMGRAGRRTVRVGWKGVKYLPWLPTLLLIALVLLSLPVLLSYFALTQESVAAEVIMSAIQTDETGKPYIDIEFIPFERNTAWDTALYGATPPQELPRGEPVPFRVYGDTVAVRGPLITLHQGWRILNFDNIYKLALIEGEYRAPGSNYGEGSEFEINGGFEEFWWDINAQEATFPYNTIIKRVTFSGDEEPGFIGTGRKRYQIVITNDNITWNWVEDLP